MDRRRCLRLNIHFATFFENYQSICLSFENFALFATETKDFEFCFTPDSSILQPTEIFLGTTQNYYNGASVECTAGLHCNPASIPSDWYPTPQDDVLWVTNNISATANRTTIECVRLKGNSKISQDTR